MNIGDLCRRQIVTCTPEANLGEVARLMRSQHVGTVLVCEPNRRPVGIVTDRDIVLEVVAADMDAKTVNVGEVMSRNPVTALEDDDVAWALKVMRDCGIRRRAPGLEDLDPCTSGRGMARSNGRSEHPC